MNRLRVALAVVVALALAAMSLGYASSLTVTSRRLTAATSAVSVPKSVVSISQSAVGGGANTAHTTTATLTGGTSSAGGTLTFTLFPGAACSGTAVSPGAQTINPITGAAGQSYTSAARVPTTAGTYSWLAAYSGDPDNVAASSCTQITVTAALTLHVSALSVTAVNQNTQKWQATVTVTVRDQANVVVSGVIVTGSWSPTSSASGSCGVATSAAGTCTVFTGNSAFDNSPATNTQTWTVSNLTKAGYTYDAAANTPSSITVTKP